MALQPGANVSAVARSEGLDPSQLYGWRRTALASGAVAPLTDGTETQKFARVETRSRGAPTNIECQSALKFGCRNTLNAPIIAIIMHGMMHCIMLSVAPPKPPIRRSRSKPADSALKSRLIGRWAFRCAHESAAGFSGIRIRNKSDM
ncbi:MULTISPECIES: transposase [Rhizobium]|uniref:transposase n=1 Tax=Rhizobium TaxID=379 RepID=UPI001F4858FC|nr:MULTISPECIES: transposase [Rhizobium]